MHRDYLSHGNAVRCRSDVLWSQQLYLDNVICCRDIVFRLHRVDYSFENGCDAPND
jgi:hypothetical protein